MAHVLIVGAGLSGSVIARVLADAGHDITLVDERPHVAGNCHTALDEETGILLHVYGAHIFHTDKQEVWDFVTRFTPFTPYVHRVKTISQGQVYSLPVNLLTINQFFRKSLSPAEAHEFLHALGDSTFAQPANFEEQALFLLGRDLYEAFFRGYTCKQWGREPKDLPASILTRLPVRFNYDDNYFSHAYQGLPDQGYTALVEAMLNHPRITLELNTPYTPDMLARYNHVFYSGPIDRYFDYSLGRLPYRSVEFQCFRAQGDYQGCAVMNYADPDVPWTRIIEHKHFATEQREKSVLYREIPKECGPHDIPYYPVRFASRNELLEQYQTLAAKEKKVTFVGRLGTFRYLDMDQTIENALHAARQFLVHS